MSPRAVAAWSAAAVTLAVATANPVYRLIVLLAGVNLLLGLRRPGTSLRPLAIGCAVAFVLSCAVSVALNRVGDHPFLTLPAAIPLIGGGWSVEGLLAGASVGVGVAAALVAAAPLVLLAEPDAIAASLPGPLRRTATALSGALMLIPSLQRTAVAVGEAQRMRGIEPRGPRGWSAVVVPVVLSAVEDSVQRAEAMEARGYGAGAPSRVPSRRTGGRGIVVILAAVAAVALGVAEIVRGAAVDWNPAPSPTLPTVDPLMVMACLLLVTPLLLWTRPASS